MIVEERGITRSCSHFVLVDDCFKLTSAHCQRLHLREYFERRINRYASEEHSYISETALSHKILLAFAATHTFKRRSATSAFALRLSTKHEAVCNGFSHDCRDRRASLHLFVLSNLC